MTYDELVAAISAWVNRPEAEPQIPVFIALAEAQMNRAFAEGGVANAVVSTAVSLAGSSFAAPADMTLPLGLTLTTGQRLENVTAAGFDDLQARAAARAGRPAWYSLAGSRFRVTPVPDKTYAATLIYARRLISLTGSGVSNWVLAQYPDAYLYGALVHSAPFLGDDQRLQVWASLFNTALDGILKAERAKRGSQTTAAYRPHMLNRHGSYGLTAGGPLNQTGGESGGTPPLAPANVALPVITGVATSGQTLMASAGAWSGSPTSFAYVWRRDGAAIIGAAGNSYVLLTADIGHQVSVTVTAANAAGSASATSASTAAISAGSGGSFSPFVVDLPQTGETLLNLDLSAVPIGNGVTVTNTAADIVLDYIYE